VYFTIKFLLKILNQKDLTKAKIIINNKNWDSYWIRIYTKKNALYRNKSAISENNNPFAVLVLYSRGWHEKSQRINIILYRAKFHGYFD
jgi:hypothetical protein